MVDQFEQFFHLKFKLMLSVGLVGLPNAGKSTLFNLLTKKTVPAENFPFCTIDPHDGLVKVQDDRVDQLAKLCNSQKVIHTAIEFRDIAGLVRGASQGEGLGSQFLAHIHSVDLILFVIRCFQDDDILHVESRVNPIEDEEILMMELTLHDEKRLESLILKLEKEARKDPEAKMKIQISEKIMTQLSDIRPASDFLMDKTWDESLHKWRKSLNLLTDKPILKLANIKEDGQNHPYKSDFDLDIKVESEVIDLDTEARKELGLASESGLDKMIKSCYDKLNLATYLTCGETETRAWTFEKGMTAKECAGIIHTDFSKNFIKAEVASFEDLVVAGGWKGVREQGKARIEGKDYLFQDGDVTEFKV